MVGILFNYFFFSETYLNSDRQMRQNAIMAIKQKMIIEVMVDH